MQSLTDFRAKERLLLVYTGMLRRARERKEREVAGPNETRQKISNVAPEEIPPRLTRSKTSPFNIDRLFFFVTAVSLAGKPFYFYYPALTYRVFSNDRNQLKKRYDIDYARLTSGIFMREFIETNNVHEDLCYRKTLKPLTQILIPEEEFHRPPKANESEDTGWHHSSNRKEK